MSPRLASAITSRPAARASATTSASAVHPGAPRRSKQASCGFTPTQCSATASITSLQCAVTARAARTAGGADESSTPPTSSSACGHRSAGSGSRPSTSCDCLRTTRSANRSPKCSAVASAVVTCEKVARRPLVDRLLEGGASAELRNLGRGDLDLLAGGGIATLARSTSRNAELPKPGEDNIAAALQCVLDRLQDRI